MLTEKFLYRLGLLAAPFFIWVVCFWYFVSGQFGFTADAISYYEHIGFFTDHLTKGDYPLWHPFWFDGAPYHFFLRRIGEFNPLFSLVVIFKLLGMPPLQAYLAFLIIYYALSVIGFYLLLRRLFTDHIVAYSGYLLLLFSSWGTQLFYNYIILLFLPLVWFFYFLISFAQQSKRYQWVGLCLCLGIVLTTYIPFYFLTILSLVVLMTVALFFKQVCLFINNLIIFAKRHRLLMLLSGVFLVVSLIPSYQIYRESKQGDFVMPARGTGSQDSSAVAVSLKKVSSGDFINNSAFDKYVTGLSNIRLGDFYIPYVFLVMIVIACFARINRLVVGLLATIIILLLITITESSSLHAWLFDKIYFFKFIRNIYYFFWLAILPLAIMWVCACWQSLISEFKLLQSALSSRRRLILAYGLIVVAIVPHSVFIYQLLSTNMRDNQDGWVYEDKPYQAMKFKTVLAQELVVSDAEKALKRLQSNLYYASRWYVDLDLNIDRVTLKNFSSKPVRLIDNSQIINPKDPMPWDRLEQLMTHENNLVLLNGAYQASAQRHLSEQPLNYVMKSKDLLVQWAHFSANKMSFKVNIDAPKFLLIVNNYHPQWHAYINGRQVPLYRADYAYMGVWLPKGQSQVEFRFGSVVDYCWHWGMMFVYFGVLIYLLVSWVRCDDEI